MNKERDVVKEESGLATPMSIDRQISLTKEEDRTNNMKMRYDVKHYLTDICKFPIDLCTEAYVDLFLKNRAKNHNRKKYTIRGEEIDKIQVEGDWREPTKLIRLLVDNYKPECVDLIDNLDIYTLPSFNLNNLDDIIKDAVNLDELGDGLMDGVSAIGGKKEKNDDKDDINVDEIFEKWDKNGTKKLEPEEFFSAIQELSKLGIDFDLDNDGDINEEVEALFDLLDEDDDMFITYEEFAAFVEEWRSKEERDVLEAYTVFDWHPIFGPFVFVFVYILYGMSIITQFMIPTMITLSYLHGDLGEGDAKYKALLGYPDNCDPEEQGDMVDVIKRMGQGSTGCAAGGPHYWNALCPNQEEWDIKLSGAMLFLFLLVATPVADLVNSIYEGGKDEQFYLIKHSRFCEDTFFKKTAPVINLLCFGTILVTTYLLFMSAPQVDQLLLNVIAVNFLIEVDNICITTVIDDKTKERMIAKMVMWYVVEGEKQEEEMGDADFYILKKIVGTLFGQVAGWVGIIIYTLSWFQPILVYVCM